MRNICCQLAHLDYDLCAVHSISICMLVYVCVCVHNKYIVTSIIFTWTWVCRLPSSVPLGTTLKRDRLQCVAWQLMGSKSMRQVLGQPTPCQAAWRPGCLYTSPPLPARCGSWLPLSICRTIRPEPECLQSLSPSPLRLSIFFCFSLLFPFSPFPNSLSHFSLF